MALRVQDWHRTRHTGRGVHLQNVCQRQRQRCPGKPRMFKKSKGGGGSFYNQFKKITIIKLTPPLQEETFLTIIKRVFCSSSRVFLFTHPPYYIAYPSGKPQPHDVDEEPEEAHVQGVDHHRHLRCQRHFRASVKKPPLSESGYFGYPSGTMPGMRKCRINPHSFLFFNRGHDLTAEGRPVMLTAFKAHPSGSEAILKYTSHDT